eukprot:g18235.t1
MLLAILAIVLVEGVDPRSGRCSVPIPNAFSCKDLDVWRTFLELFQANAQQGFPVDGELFDIADLWKHKLFHHQSCDLTWFFRRAIADIIGFEDQPVDIPHDLHTLDMKHQCKAMDKILSRLDLTVRGP